MAKGFFYCGGGGGGLGGGNGLTRMDHSFVDGEKVKRKNPLVRGDVSRTTMKCQMTREGGQFPLPLQ